MKRKMALLLAGFMAVSMLSGCGKAEEGQEKQEESVGVSVTDENSEEVQKEVAEEVTEIVIWSANAHSKEYMIEEAEKFNETIGKENNIKVVYEVYSDAQQLLDVAIINGEGEPDIWSNMDFAKAAENGYVLCLDDIPELEDFMAEHNDYRVNGVNCIEDKCYRVPVGSQAYGLAYNKDMFVEAGIVDENGEAKPPTTLEEMIECARILTQPDKQQYGMIFPLQWGSSYGYEIEYTSYGITGFARYDARTGLYNRSEGIAPLLNTMMTIKDEGLMYPGTEALDNDQARARFAEGNVGMKFCVTWDIGVWNDQFPAKFDLGIAPVPVIDEDNAYMQKKGANFSAYISASNAAKKGTEKVAIVFEWLHSDEILAGLCVNCGDFPWDADVLNTVNLDGENLAKGLADFAEIIAISTPSPLELSIDVSGYSSNYESFVNDVWSGKVSVEEWLAERDKIYNEGVTKYKEAHPDVDQSDRIIPDYEYKKR